MGPRPDFGENSEEGGKLFRGDAAILALGMLGVRMYPCPHKVLNYVTYAATYL